MRDEEACPLLHANPRAAGGEPLKRIQLYNFRGKLPWQLRPSANDAAWGRVTEPARVLEEAYPASDIVTSFHISPANAHCSVRIWTELNSRSGPLGWLEQKLARRYLQKVYRQELALIDAAVR